MPALLFEKLIQVLAQLLKRYSKKIITVLQCTGVHIFNKQWLDKHQPTKQRLSQQEWYILPKNKIKTGLIPHLRTKKFKDTFNATC